MGLRVVAGVGIGVVAWESSGMAPGCSVSGPVGVSRRTRQSRAHRSAMVSVSGAFRRLPLSSSTAPSQASLPGRAR